MIIFDGNAEAARRKSRLAESFKKYPQLSIYSLVFQEDHPSMIYATLKQKDAKSVGVGYELNVIPIATPVDEIQKFVAEAGRRSDIQGIIIQKPSKYLVPSALWWEEMVAAINPKKDVDGLRPNSAVLPATARAILSILEIALAATTDTFPKDATASVIGRSTIVGKPVADELEKRYPLHMFRLGRMELQEHPEILKRSDLVVSATGQPNLISAAMLKKGVIAIDAGSPKPEINPHNLNDVAAFLSPVPGGVGPMTRVCLLENLLDLVEYP